MPRKRRLFMNIAVVADGKSIESMVSEEFVLCNYLLIVNMDNMEFDTLENKGDLYGETLANSV